MHVTTATPRDYIHLTDAELSEAAWDRARSLVDDREELDALVNVPYRTAIRRCDVLRARIACLTDDLALLHAEQDARTLPPPPVAPAHAPAVDAPTATSLTSLVHYVTTPRDGAVALTAERDLDGAYWVVARLRLTPGVPTYAVRLGQDVTYADALRLKLAIATRLHASQGIAWNLIDAAIVDAFPLSDDHTRRLTDRQSGI
jgi:hypothetical protein